MKKYIIVIVLLYSNSLFAQIDSFAVNGYAIPISGRGNWSAVVIDYNNDGWNDIFVSRAFQKDLFLKNNGNGTFSASPDTAAWQIAGGSYKAISIDVNKDGFNDIVIARGPETGGTTMDIGHPGYEQLLINNGNGTFTDRKNNFPTQSINFLCPNINQWNYTMGVASGNFNNDTIPDFIFVNGALNMLAVPKMIDNFLDPAFKCSGTYNMLLNDLYLSGTDTDADNIVNYTEPVEVISGIKYSDLSTDVAVADFDNNGWDDIFVVNYYHSLISAIPPFNTLNDTAYFCKLYLNNSSSPGQFNWDKTKFPLIKYPATSVATDDVNNDGFPDLIITMDYRGTGNIYERTRLFINDGTGAFTDSTNQYLITADTTYSTGFEAQFADINNDGKKDLFVAGQKSKLFIKQTDNTFLDMPNSIPLHQSVLEPHIFSALGSCIDDFSGDGKKDIVLADSYEQLRLWFQNSTAQFIDTTTTNLPPNGENTEAVAFGDLDNDGDEDIVNSVYLESIFASMYIQNGTIGGYPFFKDNSNIFPSQLTNNKGTDIADVNSDGWKDIIISGYNGTKIFKNNGGLNFTDNTSVWGTAFSSSLKTNRLQFEDLNNDGLTDVFFPDGTEGGAGEQNRIYSWNNSTTTFDDKTSLWLPTDNATSIDVDFADINNDGFKDIIVANQNSASFIYLTSSPTTTNPNYTLLSPFTANNSTGVHFGDFNGDNLMDVVDVSSNQSNPIKIYLNTGTATNPIYNTAQNILNTGVSGATWDVDVYDINSDGNDDIITADFGESKVFISNGNGTFTDSTTTYFPQDEFREAWFAKSLRLYDINQDGIIDIYFCRDNQDLIFYGHSSTVSSINEINQNKSDFIVFPNPLSIQTTLRSDNSLHNATLTVYNLSGQQIKQIKNINGQTISLQRDNLPSGLYFIRLTEDSKVIATEKLIIMD
ncbi:MAG: T9SS type A sorting domain-containing protein [Flavobacteriales bacterium]|nr:T9SS type A sorting domain-containing protein [Flavobacteriales bacterium]MCB9174900.1 T9SS type A sorting domain-containing protein [Flavobacteriales bacterium]